MIMVMDLSKKESYVFLLDRALAEIRPLEGRRGDRLIELKPQVIQEQKYTIITNHRQIAQQINRDPSHLARFIFKEMGRPGTVEGDRLVISGKLSNEELARVLQIYHREFVKCPVCGGVDTRIVSEKRFRFLVCEVCGAKSPVRKI